MSTDLMPRLALIALAALLAGGAQAQPAAPGQPPPNAVSIEQPAVFDVASTTGALKETVQKGQQLVWRARRSPNDRRFELTDMSVALLRNEAPSEGEITFARDGSAGGRRPGGGPEIPGLGCPPGGAAV